MRYGLQEDAIDAINEIFAQYDAIEKVVLYGSRAKGNYKPGSDIDLTIIDNGLTQRHLHRIANQLDDLLLPYTFDLSLFRTIKHAALIDHIHRVGCPFLYAED